MNDNLAETDSLIDRKTRARLGEFYTPLCIVDKAYSYLDSTIGSSWQEDYILWDMCGGVGNLELRHANKKNVFISTIKQQDIDVMKQNGSFADATLFQYDYLNDDIADDGTIDYGLTNKMPPALREALSALKEQKKDAKKILVLINPPYAEAGRGLGKESKGSVAKSKVATHLMRQAYGKATNELVTQFMARIAVEMPHAVVAMFSKLKYVNAPNFEKFREVWCATYKAGFVVQSQAFDGMKGNFPIGFLIWQTQNPITQHSTAQPLPLSQTLTTLSVEVFKKDKDEHKRLKITPIGEKTFYNLPANTYLNKWIERPKANKDKVIPLKNAFTPTTGKVSLNTWSNGALAYLLNKGNDVQNAPQATALFSSAFHNGHGFYVTENNLGQAAVVFAVRRLIKATWLNDRDQFLQPTGILTDEFKTECLIWMLFNGSNLTASADGLEWGSKTWTIVNHFIPFTEEQVEASGRFESDFMVKYLKGKKISVEAKAVMNEGLALWKAYFKITDTHATRDGLKLNRPDVGWYQIRNSLLARKTDFTTFKASYKVLSDKLVPMVYALGFLKP